MTFIRGSGNNNNTFSSQFSSGTFAHTGLNLGASGQAPNANSQDSGSGTLANSNAGTPAPSAGNNIPQDQAPGPTDQGNSSSGTGQPGSGDSTQNQAQEGERARKAAEDELKALQRRMAEIQGLLATTDRSDKLFVDPSSLEEVQDLPKSFSPGEEDAQGPRSAGHN
ncbi:hypothetical protein F5880DRAFT_1613927 [Lentinula raphanica]|nr:hypothetical protein F5880DRAFT_1613927 [Lentinula raphanica]